MSCFRCRESRSRDDLLDWMSFTICRRCFDRAWEDTKMGRSTR